MVKTTSAVFRLKALSPPSEVTDWHNASLAFLEALRDLADSQPRVESLDPQMLLSLAPQWREVENATDELAPDIREQLIEAGCIVDEETAGSTDQNEVSEDRDALVALYNATDGANWVRNRDWLSEKPIRRWLGVRTDRNGRVTALRLSGYGLNGELPPEIGNLSELVELDLNFNRLRGRIPAELGNLSNLEVLYLRREQGLPEDAPAFSGEIPPDLALLQNLVELDLSGHRLTGEIPSELGNLKNLQKLNLRNNRLSGPIPAEMGELSELVHLRLNGNALTGGIPPALGGLQRALIIDLASNELTGAIPPEMGNLVRVRILGLHANMLTGHIPPQLGLLENLTRLNLHENRLDGSIPPELSQLTNLEVLTLHSNQLSGEIPPELGLLENLEVLFLYENQLSGEIPPELAQLRKMKLLGMHDNRLTGEVPPALLAIPSLIAVSVCEATQVNCDIADAVGEGLEEGTKALFDAVATTGGAVGSIFKGLLGGWW